MYFRVSDFSFEMDVSLPLGENSSLPKNEASLEKSNSRKGANQNSKRCRFAILGMLWVATCIPSNIIGAIFFYKTQNLPSFQSVRNSDASDLDMNNLIEIPTISSEHVFNTSSDLKDEVISFQ